jgi:predicted transcriptional regulator
MTSAPFARQVQSKGERLPSFGEVLHGAEPFQRNYTLEHIVSEPEAIDLVALTADLTSAHLSNNEVASDQVPVLIRTIHEAFASLGNPPEPVEAKPAGAVSVRRSLSEPDRIISMIDGKPYKMLKRHIGLHGYTPASYRQAFDLPASYPMVAPSYSERRSTLAQSLGLGRKPKGADVKPSDAAEEPSSSASPQKAHWWSLGKGQQTGE